MKNGGGASPDWSQETLPHHTDRECKEGAIPPKWNDPSLLKNIAAVTYSPTTTKLQYHQREWA